MENRFKLRISRLFRSSFGSCRSKNITDAIEKPILLPDNREKNKHHHQFIELLSPKPQKCPQNLQTIDENLKKSLLLSADMEGQKCPPASPITPLHQFQDCATTSSKTKTKEKKKKKTVNERVRLRSKSFGHLNQFPALSYNGLFSSDEDDDEEDDKTTLFSSRSLSSDSSESFIRKNNKACKNNYKRASKNRQKKAERDQSSEAAGPVPELKGKVKDSFAVVKRSSDPYNDFRTSMVEMIVERKIFSAKDLENLLQCFLSLNSHHHHRVIIEVFTEIWEALFSEWS
ncbi:hypothetical protein ACH5RR_005966 [Cinchona calisaya]|uniref:Transcription repressor n=1 Tax=Cinchona calisaya TaxID=153742 RepID=A0ABD3AMM3_9GENT